ncbi:type II toxin-antitoxin system Phd/YefM family antitoxin [Phycisphaera mikurensis]|uniref:type II toxin-antitoxin system Phd/YefM family antitoxin n=1 Tax=Phycisphaera mikurensis TaxID=547188 RepID=UPI000946141B|nr:type II toxin-antitoxin system prevent-host-death family antitoxin [Phycisphaera mikurensis]MBB6441763.1 prevent-host-death family protein [Phycisphaera mikurensis]
MKQQAPSTEEETGSREAEAQLSNLLERVAKGEAFAITRRGEVVARLIPDKSCQRERVESAVETLLASRGGVKGTTRAEAQFWRDEGRMQPVIAVEAMDHLVRGPQRPAGG